MARGGRSKLGVVLVALLLTVGCAHGQPTDLCVPESPAPLSPCVSAAVVAKSQASTSGLTMAEAVRLAVERNPDLGMAEARIQAAQAFLAGAEAARNPILSGDVSLMAGNAPSMYLMKRIDARNFSPNTDLNDPGTFWNLEVGTTFRYNLWDGGRRDLGVCQARSGVDRARYGRHAVENDLAATVAAVWLQARAAEELLVADEASMKTVAAQVEETRVRVERGSALRSDLLSLEVRLARAEERKIRTELARKTALAGLRRLLALPAGQSITLARGDLRGGELPTDPQSALVEAYRSRPELKAARHAVRQGRYGVEQARRGTMPTLDLEARWYGDDEGLSLSSNVYAAVALNFDLWDGGRTRANVLQARAVVDRLEEQDRKALLGVAHDVETAYLQLEQARARLAVAEKAVGAADETLQLVDTQYRAGAVTVTRFLEVESDRTMAQTSRIRAELDLNRAVVNARRALGRLQRRRFS